MQSQLPTAFRANAHCSPVVNQQGDHRSLFCVRPRLVLTVLLIVLLVWGSLPPPAYALPAGFQEYYILGNETQVARMFEIVRGDLPDPMVSGITIVATADHQVIYYDHWEDGYEADILNPGQGSTEVYGDGAPITDTLKAGDIITLNSDGGTGIHANVPVNPRGTDLRYDGSDRLVSIGGPIDVVHSLWPSDNTWVGGVWEIYPVGTWATGYSYIVPVGVDLSFSDFQYTWLEIQALDDNTTVYVDNGSETISVRMEQGQSYSSMGYLDSITAGIPAITINSGTTVLANKPIQGGLVTAGSSTQTRFYTLVPDTAWGTEYVAPIPRTTDNEETEVYLFNPDDKDHTVTAYELSAPGGITFTLPATTTLAYSQTTGYYVTSTSALRLRSDAPLWAVASADTGDTTYDWGFSFIPTRFAGRDYYVSWAPGSEDLSGNGSPVWVAPLTDNTVFRVDYSDPTIDGTPDEYFVLDSLHTRRIFDPDNDNTGMRIQADKPFVVIWGEDPFTAGTGTPYLDLGYSVLPLNPDWLDPVLTLHKTSDVQALPPSGGTVTFTLSIQAADYPVSNVNITDTLPISWTYVADSTGVTYPDSSTGNPEPTIVTQTLSWPLSTTLDPNQSLTLTFQAQLTMTGGLGDTCYDDLESGDYNGGLNWGGPWTEYEPGGCSGNCVDNTTDTSNGSPHSGSYHLVVRSSGAISRTADISGFQQPALRFWRRLNALESGDALYLRLYDGASWTTVLTFTDNSGQGTYTAEQLDLTSYQSSNFALELRGDGANDGSDYLYLDDVEIFDAAATQENTAEATGSYQGYLFSSRDEAVITLSSLTLQQSVDKATAVGGDTLLYTLTYSNSSQTLTMTNVLIRDILPANTTFLSASSGATYLPVAHAVVWGRSPTMTLAPGVSGTLTVTVSVDYWVSNGQVLRSEGYVDSDQTVEVAGNPVETIVQAPEVSLVKSGPASANPDQVITYTIEYANTGPVTATGVIITDIIPLSTTYQAGSLAIDTGSGYVTLTDAYDGDAGYFTGSAISVRPGGLISGQIGPGEVGTIRFAVRISSTVPVGENVANYATLVRDYARPQNSALLLTAVSDLTLEKAADRSVAGPGSSIVYTVTLGSGGALTQTEVYVRDSIPDHTGYLSGTAVVPPGFVLSYSIDHGETWTSTAPATPTLVTDLRWYTPTISGTVGFDLGYQVRVEDPLSQGNVVIANRAQVTSTQTVLLYSNEVHIQTVDLVVNKIYSGSPVTPGQRVTYTIIYGNNGSAAAPGTLITDRVPVNTTLVPGSVTGGGTTDGQFITWTVDLPAQASGLSVRFAVTVTNPLPAGVDTITNTVVITSGQELSATDTITTPVIAAPDLVITKTDGVDFASPGDVLTYTLTITNAGNQGATGLVVTDTLPTHTTFITASNGGIEGGGDVTWTIGSLTAGASLTRTLTVSVDPMPAGVEAITNTVTITDDGANGLDLNPGDNTAVVTTTIYNPVFTLTKQADNYWTRRVKLTFTNTAPTTLTDFPVLVVLDSSRINYSQTLTNGQDIRFIDPDGTLLAHEIEEWNTNGTSYVWVKVPQIDGSSITDHIWLYYGNPGASDGQDPENVWSSYRMVYHLEEDPSTSGGVFQDSTANNFDATNQGSVNAVGLIANAQEFTRTSSQYVNLGSDLAVINQVSAATLSAWIRPDTVSDDGDILGLSIGGSPTGSSRAAIAQRGANVQIFARSRDDDSDYHNNATTSTPLSASTWHYVAAVFDYANDAITITVDGVPQAMSGPIVAFDFPTTPNTNSANAAIGSDDDGASPFFDGLIDEARVAATVRSSDWISAQYRSMTDSFIAFSSEEQVVALAEPTIVGTPFTYTITITNTGLVAATDVVVTETLPTDAYYVSGGTLVSGDTVSWTLPTVPVSSSAQATFVVSTCQTSLINDAYRVVTSTQNVTSADGPALVTLMVPPTIVADFTYSPLTITVGSAVYLTDTSTTNGSSIVDWAWDFGDSSTGSGSATTHTYSSPGTYTVTLTVTDACNYTDTVTRTVQVYSPVLTIAKTSTHPTPLAPGDTITYTIVVSNSGYVDATGAVVSDSLPANTDFVTGSITLDPPGAGIVGTVPPILVSGLTITAGQRATVTFAVTVNIPLAIGTVITNTAAVTSTEILTPSTDTVTVTVRGADLSIGKSSTPKPAVPGEVITYTITVSNPGGSYVTGATVSDTFPTDISGISWTCSPSGGAACTASGSGGIDDTISLPSASVVTYTVTGTLSASVTATLVNTATVIVPVGATDTITANNVATDTNIPSPRTDLVISKSDGPDPVAAASTLTYTLSVSNAGPSAASTLTVTDVLPPGVTFGGASGAGWSCGHASGVVTCTRPSLSVGIAPDVVITVTAPVTGGTIINTASISATTADPDASNNVTTTSTLVTATVDLELSKAVIPGSAVPGQPLTYTLTFTNNGAQPATGVVITDVVPITLTNVSYVSSGAQVTPTGSLSYTWQIADLAPGAGGTITVTGVISPDLITDTSLINSAIITTSMPTVTVDTDPTDNSDSVTTTINLPRASFDSATYSVDEGVGTALITVTLNAYPYVTTTVDYATADGTATAGSDYAAASGTLTFTAGTATLTFTVPITDDAVDENDETVLLTLGSPSCAVLATPYTVTLTIIDDDAATVAISDTSVLEGDVGTANAVFTVTLSTPSATTVTVDYITTDNTALQPADYVTQSGTITFAPGITARYITVTVNGDTSNEGNESFTVDLSNASGATIVDSQAVGTIIDDDLTADLAVSKVVDNSAPYEGDTVVYTITVTNNGPSTATTVALTDTLPAGVTYVSDNPSQGSYNNGTGRWDIGSLANGNTATLILTATVDAGTAGTTIINTTIGLSAEQTDPNAANDQDSATIVVKYNPAVSIVKDGPSTANVGSTALFTFTVTNDNVNGDGSPISIISVSDDYAGTANYTGGDDGDGFLETGETWIYTASYVIQSTDPSPLINTATVIGQDGEGDPVTDTASHSTALEYAPGLRIIKLGPATAELGQTVVYTFIVGNTSFTPTSIQAAGDGSPISNIVVTDSIASPINYASGDSNSNNLLELGEVWVYTASYTIQSTDPDPLINTATATGRDGNGDLVGDSDNHSLDIIHIPVLNVTKDGLTAANVDDTVTFTFTVTNDNGNGDGSPIGNITVVDSVASPVNYIGGDSNGNNLLETGETWVYTTLYTIQSTDPRSLVNVCTVTGQDRDGDPVIDTDTHSTTVEGGTILIYLPIVLRNY